LVYEKILQNPVQDIAPIQTKKTMFRVSRGGSWRSGEERCQSRARNRDVKDHHISNSGFRLVLEK
jgi:formylglycine-generating enzyme required for sulfatase activity